MHNELSTAAFFVSWGISKKIMIFAAHLLETSEYSLYGNGLSSFQAGGTKLERFLPKNQHTRRKLLNFENWLCKIFGKMT